MRRSLPFSRLSSRSCRNGLLDGGKCREGGGSGASDRGWSGGRRCAPAYCGLGRLMVSTSAPPTAGLDADCGRVSRRMAAAIHCPRKRMPQPNIDGSDGRLRSHAGFSMAMCCCGRQLGDSGGVLCSGKSPVARAASACGRVSARECCANRQAF